MKIFLPTGEGERCSSQRCFRGMRRSSYYREQADHARLLATITVQHNVAEVLSRAAEEFDRLADETTSRDTNLADQFGHEYLEPVSHYLQAPELHHK